MTKSRLLMAFGHPRARRLSAYHGLESRKIVETYIPSGSNYAKLGPVSSGICSFTWILRDRADTVGFNKAYMQF